MDITKKLVPTFSIEECNVIKSGLLELPGKICNPVIEVMDREVMEQLKPTDKREVTDDKA